MEEHFHPGCVSLGRGETWSVGTERSFPGPVKMEQAGRKVQHACCLKAGSFGGALLSGAA